MTEEFDPYYEWLGIPPKDQPPHHYRLLGIELFEQNLNVIERAADRQMGHVRSFQTGRHSRESQKLLNELSSAKVCLLNPQRKAEYDDQLRLKISSSLPDLGLFGDSQIPGFPPPLSDALPPEVGTTGPSVPIPPQLGPPLAGPPLPVAPGAAMAMPGVPVPGGNVPTGLPNSEPWPGAAFPITPESVRVHVASTVTDVANNGSPAAPPRGAATSPPRPLLAKWYAGAATSDTSEPRPGAAWQQLAIGVALGLLLLVVAVGGWWWSTGEEPVVKTTPPATSETPVTPTPPVTPPETPSPPTPPEPPPPVEKRIPSWLQIAENVEGPVSPAPSSEPPVIPEGLRAQLQGAGGLIENSFAFCQTLLGDRFAKLHDELRGLGYRLARFRPYVGLGECRVAAIWYRDFLPSRCIALTDVATLRAADATFQAAGFIPVDVLGLSVEGQEYFSAVWVQPATNLRATRLTLSMAEEKYSAEVRRQKKAGYRSAVHGVHFAGENRRCSDIWVATTEPNDTVGWEGGVEAAVQQLAVEQLTVDASITVSPTTNTPVVFGLRWPTSAPACQGWTGLAPDAGLTAARDLVAAGLRPITLSVASMSHGELQSVATWRPSDQPATVLELASIAPSPAGSTAASVPPGTPSPTVPPPSPPMPEPSAVAGRALQLTTSSSIELSDTVGQARISTDFTIETWVRLLPPAFGTANLLFGTAAYKGTHPEVSDVEMKGWLMGLKPASPESGGKSQFILYWMSEGKTVTHSGEFAAWTPGWHHLAVCNRGTAGDWRMEVYLDGQSVLEATDAKPQDLPGPVPLYLGKPRWVPEKRRGLPCLISGFRLSQGIRYAAAFQPERGWQPDDQTLVLLDFSGDPSPSTIRDRSPKQRDGRLTQVTWTDSDGNPVAATTTAASPSPPPTPTPSRLPIPANLDDGIAKIRSVFQAELAAAKDASQHLALADRLLGQAETETDSLLQFALFVEARRLAVEAGDWPVVSRSIDLEVAKFDENPWTLRGEAFTGLNKRVKGTSDRKTLATTALDLAESALNEEAFDSVESLLSSASSLSPRGEKEMVKQIADVRRQLAEEKKSQQAVRDAKEKLTNNPDDPGANDVLGRYYCFVRDDWDVGTNYLAKSSSSKLAVLADSESDPPIDADGRAQLADGWYEYAKSVSDATAKGAAAGRAAYWYRLAAADATGVKKLQWEKHLEDLEKIAPSRTAKSRFAWHDGNPGLALELTGHAGRVGCLAIARSGRFLVSGGMDDTIRIWDLATGKQSGQLDTGSGNQNVHSLLLGPDDRTIVVPYRSQREFRLGLWNLQTRQAVGSVETAWVGNFLVGSADWKRVVHASQQTSLGNLLVYDLTSLKPVTPLTCPGPPTAVAVSRSGRYVAAADGSNTVYVWDLQSGKPPTPLTGQGESIFSLSFAPNERQLLSGGYRTLVIWDVTKGTEDRRISLQGTTTFSTFSPDGARILVSPNTAALHVLSARDGTLIGELTADNQPGGSSTRGIHCFSDGRTAATFGDDVTIRIWRLP